jgi:putative ABC transport system permease protein
LWPGQSPAAAIGRKFRQSSQGIVTTVGVVGDVRTATLEEKPMPQVYRPYSQGAPLEMSLVIRSARDPGDLARAATAELHAIDPNLPAPAMRTMYQMVSNAVSQRRFETVLILIFAAIALGLAVVGTYGVVSYSVRRRTSEVGLRMALGAGPGVVMGWVMKEGLRPVIAGLAIGIVGAVAMANGLRSQLFGVGPLDPLALGGVAAVLLMAAAGACYLPARWASRVDPLQALRHQ